ncbi:MAG: hypothetical protein P4M02_11725 [Clostridia bacterium]|nr:hypothetical protein [Clostridia bacterium]
MAYNGFVPSKEFQKFQKEHGEDTFIMMNLLYAAFEMNDVYDENTDEGEYDDLCDIVLEMFLDDEFEDYTLVDVADGAVYIINDSNYTVREYVETYRRKRDKVVEELLALLEREPLEDDETPEDE